MPGIDGDRVQMCTHQPQFDKIDRNEGYFWHPLQAEKSTGENFSLLFKVALK